MHRHRGEIVATHSMTPNKLMRFTVIHFAPEPLYALMAIAVGGWLGALGAPASAAINIVAPTIALPYSATAQTGSFEVVVQNSGAASQQIGDDSVEISLGTSVTGFTFTGGGATMTTPYLFPGSLGPRVSEANANETIQATDFASTNDANATLQTAGTLGLLKANFQVTGGTSGQFPLNFISIATDPLGTVLHDQATHTITTTLQSGLLVIQAPIAYWHGTTDGIWTTDNLATGATNWRTTLTGPADTHIPPGNTTDVFFTAATGATHLSTTLGTDFSIKGLTFTGAATTPVSIGGPGTLTLGVDGLTVQSGSSAHTINTAVTLGASQIWNVANAPTNPLTIGGVLTVGAGQTLTKTGGGEVSLTAQPALQNGSNLLISAGTIKIQATSGTSAIGSAVTATIASGATLELAGSVPLLSNGANRAVISNSSGALGGGLVIDAGADQQVGAITGSGTTTIGAGGQLTVNSIQQSSLAIGGTSGNPGLLTIAPSNAAGQSLAAIGSGGQSVASTIAMSNNLATRSFSLLPSTLPATTAPFATNLASVADGLGAPFADETPDALSVSVNATHSAVATENGLVSEPSTALLTAIGIVAVGAYQLARRSRTA